MCPEAVLWVVTSPQDLPREQPAAPVEVITAPRGLPCQRNAALMALSGRAEAVLFLDDDFLPTQGAVQAVAQGFAVFSTASGLTGRVLADGVGRGGVSVADAAARIRVHETLARPDARPCALRRGLKTLYGCNMAVRLDRLNGTRFDERLPLYAWQEDVDFAARLPGEKIQIDALAGVHLGVVEGRETAGARLGYAQVANPAYLMGKGSMRAGHGLGLMARNVIKNHARAAWSEPWVDRAARARGNRRALADLLRARLAPERMLEISDG